MNSEIAVKRGVHLLFSGEPADCGKAMLNLPLISIIVPVYKAEAYLRKCVNSILAQTYKNLEVILVDDGSPDSCPAICDDYAEKDIRVSVIHQKNAGVICARNAGLEVARGEYIGFLDDDDWIEPDMYEILYAVIQSSAADIAACYDCIGDDKPKKVSIDEHTVFSPHEAIKKLLDNQCDLTAVWAKLFRKQTLGGLRFSPRVAIGEDVLFMVQAVIKSKKIAYIRYQCYHYTVTENSLSHGFSARYWANLNAIDETVKRVRAFDAELGEYAASHVVHMNLYFAKMAAVKGSLSSELYRKIIAQINTYNGRNTWRILPWRKRGWLLLLLMDRRAFLFARMVLRALILLRCA